MKKIIFIIIALISSCSEPEKYAVEYWYTCDECRVEFTSENALSIYRGFKGEGYNVRYFDQIPEIKLVVKPTTRSKTRAIIAVDGKIVADETNWGSSIVKF
jgi:hypothetical protein